MESKVVAKITFWKHSHLGCLINPFNHGTHILIADSTQAPKYPNHKKTAPQLQIVCKDADSAVPAVKRTSWGKLIEREPRDAGAGQAPGHSSSLDAADGGKDTNFPGFSTSPKCSQSSFPTQDRIRRLTKTRE